MKSKKYILLDSIRSCLNVGAIMRTCDGAGFDGIFLTGFTPIPPRKDISKTAIGAENYVFWEYYENPLDIVDKLKVSGVKIITLEQDRKSINLKDLKIENEDVCIILGNEISGVSEKLKEKSDIIVEIPMLGQKQSLNVATSAGILMYKILLG